MRLKKGCELLSFVRYKNLMILLFTQLFVFNSLLDESYTLTLIGLLLSTFFATAGGNIINNFFDKSADQVNASMFVYPFSDESVVVGYVCCVVSSLCFSFLLPFEATLLVFVNNITLFLYSKWLKGLPVVGNIMVALLSASSVYIFYLLYGMKETELLVFSIFTFCIHFIREVVKDIEDKKGDEVAGYRTLPVVYGEKIAKRVIVVAEVIFVMILCLLSIRITTSLWLYNVVVVVPFVLFLSYKTVKANEKKEYNSISNWCKVLMLFGVLGMLFC